MKQKLLLNLIIIIKATAISLWFYGVQRIYLKLFPDPSWLTVAILIGCASCVLLADDGLLSELYSINATLNRSIISMSQVSGNEDHTSVLNKK